VEELRRELTAELQVMLAAYHGHAPLVKLLIQHGADLKSVNDRGQSPLAGAVFKGEADVIEVCFATALPDSRKRD
jgi:ankyrin repeat protein